MYLSLSASDNLLHGSLPPDFTVASGTWVWATVYGTGTNTGQATAYQALIYNATTWPNDQWAKLSIVNSPGSAFIGPAVRISADGKSYYFLAVNPSTSRLSIMKFVSGTLSVLASAPYTPSVGDIFFIAVQGSQITGLAKGATSVSLSANDTSLLSGSAGIGANGSASSNVMNWFGGSLPYQTFNLPQGPASYGSAFFPIKKWAKFATIVQTPVAFSGEVRVSLTPFPIWMWEYDIKYLTGDANVLSSGYQYVQGFFMSMMGSANQFLFTDPFDNSVLAAPFGTGATGSPIPNGTNKAFQLTRPWISSGFNSSGSDIAQNVDQAIQVFINGVLEPASLTLPPITNLTQTSGGALAATTYFVRRTYVSGNGETMAGQENSLAVSANNVLNAASPPSVAGATGYNVYVGTSSGSETKQNSSPIAIGTPWVEPTSGLIVGASMPVSNTCGYSLGSTGVVTFNGAPLANAALAWTGSFFFLCRFGEDELQGFQEKFYVLWELPSLKFQSVIQ